MGWGVREVGELPAEGQEGQLIEVPGERLSLEARRGVLEEYVTRGGYECDWPLERRIASVEKRLRSGQLRLIFDPENGSVNIVEAKK